MMLQIFRRYGRQVAAVTALALLPSFAQANVVRGGFGGFQQPDFKYGQIHFHPKSITIGITSTLGGTANFRVHQRGNVKDRYRAQIGCLLNLGSKPRVYMNGNRGTISVGPSGLVGVDVNCTVTVLGEGGVTGTMPVLIQITL